MAETMPVVIISIALAIASPFCDAAERDGVTEGATSATAVAEATAKIKDGKAEVNGVLYHYLLAPRRQPDGRAFARLGIDLVYVAVRNAANRGQRLHRAGARSARVGRYGKAGRRL
jgi:hypothetical protein